jgi:hypothetical protein
MVSDLFFYQLALVALLWLCLMLHGVWLSERVPPGSPSPARTPLPRKRAREPKPFVGLTHKPHCAACEQVMQASTVKPPAGSPPRITSTRGRRRQVDTSHHFCPHSTCAYYGWVGLGNLSANGHPNGGPWRQLHCTRCPFRKFLPSLLSGQGWGLRSS